MPQLQTPDSRKQFNASPAESADPAVCKWTSLPQSHCTTVASDNGALQTGHGWSWLDFGAANGIGRHTWAISHVRSPTESVEPC